MSRRPFAPSRVSTDPFFEPHCGKGVEARLGYTFHNSALLAQALTHPSSGVQPDNQRLEFLGDALLRAAHSLILFREKPDWQEGTLSKLRYLLESTDALCEWAGDLDLRLRLPGNKDPRQLKTAFRKPLADAVEALLAAVFLDAQGHGEDGFAAVLRLVEARFLTIVQEAQADAWRRHDAKTELQERAARLNLPTPEYERLGQSGPDHAPSFRVRVRVGPQSAEAEGKSLKQAQAEAARRVLAALPA